MNGPKFAEPTRPAQPAESAESDASPGRSIQVECLSCGRRASLDGEAGAAPLVEVTRRLRCSGCGSRAVKACRVVAPRDVARMLRARMDRAD